METVYKVAVVYNVAMVTATEAVYEVAEVTGMEVMHRFNGTDVAAPRLIWLLPLLSDQPVDSMVPFPQGSAGHWLQVHHRGRILCPPLNDAHSKCSFASPACAASATPEFTDAETILLASWYPTRHCLPLKGACYGASGLSHAPLPSSSWLVGVVEGSA